MPHIKVDIKHPSGDVELGHVVELGAHSRRTVAEQVEDHLRVKPTKKGVRGGWTYANLQAHVPAAPKAAAPKPAAAPVPKGA